MYTKEDLKYLYTNFGTFKIQDCANCNLSSTCNHAICQFETRLAIKNLNDLKGASYDSRVQSILNRISKLKMMGFSEHIDGYWMLMTDARGSTTWICPIKRKVAKKIYKRVEVVKGFIYCETGEKSELYHVSNLDNNLLDGLDYEISFNRSMSYYSFGLNDRLIELNVSAGKIKCTLIVHKDGNRVILPGIEHSIEISPNHERCLISFHRAGKVRLDGNLNILSCGTGLFAMNI